jgi:hypothetical protein
VSTLANRLPTLARLQRIFGTNWASGTISTGVGYPGYGLRPTDPAQFQSYAVTGSSAGTRDTLNIPREGLYFVKITSHFQPVAATNPLEVRYVINGVNVAYAALGQAAAGDATNYSWESLLEVTRDDMVGGYTISQSQSNNVSGSDILSGTIAAIPVIN